jgi:hypothetical protein
VFCSNDFGQVLVLAKTNAFELTAVLFAHELHLSECNKPTDNAGFESSGYLLPITSTRLVQNLTPYAA